MDARGQRRPPAPKAGTLFAGKYRLERPIARGGMGLVYLAVQEPLGRPVAVKVLQEVGHDTSFRERFMSEASICAQLAHPHIVTIHDYGQTDEGALFMVMEYVQGETLDRVLGREVRLEPDRAIAFVRRVGAALGHAHRAGIVHRDLKPSNIVLTQTAEGEGLKVLDFGIAKAFLGEKAAAEDLTEAGKLIGTPRFMAPEQVRKQRIDQRADLYALGVLAHLVTSGRPPFEGETDVALMNAHLEAPIPALPAPLVGREPELDFLIRWLMQKRPDARPQTAEELLDHLDAAIRARTLGRETVMRSSSRIAQSSGALQTLLSTDLPFSPRAASEPDAEPAGRPRWPLALAMLSLPLLISMILWAWSGPSTPPPTPRSAPPAFESFESVEAEAPGLERPAVKRQNPVEAMPEPRVREGPSEEVEAGPPPRRPEPSSGREARRRSERRTARPSIPASPVERVPVEEAPPPAVVPKKKVPVLVDDVESTSVPVVD